MAQTAYQGHAAGGSFAAAAVADADSLLAPADRNNYDPTAYANFPGAAARANGYPRDDGRPGGNIGSGWTSEGRA